MATPAFSRLHEISSSIQRDTDPWRQWPLVSVAVGISKVEWIGQFCEQGVLCVVKGEAGPAFTSLTALRGPHSASLTPSSRAFRLGLVSAQLAGVLSPEALPGFGVGLSCPWPGSLLIELRILWTHMEFGIRTKRRCSLHTDQNWGSA